MIWDREIEELYQRRRWAEEMGGADAITAHHKAATLDRRQLSLLQLAKAVWNAGIRVSIHQTTILV